MIGAPCNGPIRRRLIASSLAAVGIASSGGLISGMVTAFARSSSSPTVLAEETPPEQAVKLANQGHFDRAIQVLRDYLEQHPKDDQARILLGRILDFDGRPDEAVALWEKALAESPADFPLLMSIGEIRMRQGTDGPTVTYRRGTVTYNPSKDAAAEERFKRSHLAQAATAYEKARKWRPDDLDAARTLARVYTAQKKPDSAVEVWRSLVGMQPKSGEYHLGLALATREAGRADEAAQHLKQAIALNPRLAEAHEALAGYQKQKGLAAEAELSRKQAEFYKRLPSFCRHLTFSEENRKTLDALDTEATVRRLVEDPSESAAEFLAALCWMHPHDRNETRAFEALEARGPGTTRLLRELFDDARSTCTIRSSAHILARRKVRGIFDELVQRLPGDQRGFGMDMDVAGSLDDLGDPRAVGPLGQVLDPGAADAAQAPGPLVDRYSARARAAMALGAFDTPESRRLLEAGTKDPSVAPYCRAALYRLTRDPKDLAALEKSVDPDQGYTTYLLGTYLSNKVDTDEARRLAKTWEERREARRKAQEAEEKRNAGPETSKTP